MFAFVDCIGYINTEEHRQLSELHYHACSTQCIKRLIVRHVAQKQRYVCTFCSIEVARQYNWERTQLLGSRTLLLCGRMTFYIVSIFLSRKKILNKSTLTSRGDIFFRTDKHTDKHTDKLLHYRVCMVLYWIMYSHCCSDTVMPIAAFFVSTPS